MQTEFIEKLALGTVQFGLNYGVANQSGQVSKDEVSNILSFARSIRIDTLDTAPRYGNSENVLGRIGVHDYRVVTKTTSLKNGIKDVIEGFYRSLKSLNQRSVDGLLIHDISEVDDKEFHDLFLQLNKLKQQELVNKIGFSTYKPEQIDFLLENFDFDLIQVPFNVFDTRLVEGGQLKTLKRKNIEIHARSVFLQGLLLDFKHLGNYFSKWTNEFNDYQEIVQESGLSLLGYAISFVLNTKEIDKVLVGVDSEKQLREIIKSTKKQSVLSPYPIYDDNLLNPLNWKSL
jgi:aryl-alcohol dehydrogenase-like predicted oxidoreductase